MCGIIGVRFAVEPASPPEADVLLATSIAARDGRRRSADGPTTAAL